MAIGRTVDDMSWEDAIHWLAQSIINIDTGLTTIERGSPAYNAMLVIVEEDLAIKNGAAQLPASWKGSAAHLAGYQKG